ncbi:MAG: enoyl-CoA hydratase/isomerase family protein [Chloroflexi bacterium]|nr:enoyl-CoA hydratase/isomerase family protein [Chloroflexota bacterium]
MTTPADELLIETKDHITTVTLNRPHALNALTMTMLDSFARLWERLNDDHDTHVVIITGAGKGFCSGIDLKQTNMAEQGKNRRPNYNFSQQWIASMQAFTKPTIAAVNGVAAGGGLGLALGCDIRIASDAARFSAIFANIGMPVLDGVGSTLPATVGIAKALEMIYTADILDANEAARIGLVSYVVPAADLMTRTRAMAEKIAAGPPIGLSMSKHVVYSSVGRTFIEHLPHQALAVLANSSLANHDIAEGGVAFRERRKPKFKGYAK